MAEPAKDAPSACSARSRVLGEPLWGTAPQAAYHALLEVRGPWAPKLPDTDLPEGVWSWLGGAAAAVEGLRPGFVRRPRRTGSYALFLVDVAARRTLRFEFEALEHACAIDIAAVFREGAHPDAVVDDSKLLLVCTHGRRDVCCARLGKALYDGVCGANAPGVEVWGASHLGGHRFAPLCLSLPDGRSYGQVPIERAAELAACVSEGRFFDARYLRGESQHPKPVQAALCRQRIATPDAEVSLRGCEGDAAKGWVVTLDVDGATSRHVVSNEMLEDVIKSCGTEPCSVPTLTPRFR